MLYRRALNASSHMRQKQSWYYIIFFQFINIQLKITELVKARSPLQSTKLGKYLYPFRHNSSTEVVDRLCCIYIINSANTLTRNNPECSETSGRQDRVHF